MKIKDKEFQNDGTLRTMVIDEDAIYVEKKINCKDIEKACKDDRESFVKYGDGMHKVASIPVNLWNQLKSQGLSDYEILLTIELNYPEFKTVNKILNR